MENTYCPALRRHNYRVPFERAVLLCTIVHAAVGKPSMAMLLSAECACTDEDNRVMHLNTRALVCSFCPII